MAVTIWAGTASSSISDAEYRLLRRYIEWLKSNVNPCKKCCDIPNGSQQSDELCRLCSKWRPWRERQIDQLREIANELGSAERFRSFAENQVVRKYLKTEVDRYYYDTGILRNPRKLYSKRKEREEKKDA